MNAPFETFDEIAERYIADRQAAGIGHSHILNLRRALKDFLGFLKSTNIENLAAVDQKTIDAYIDEVWGRAFERIQGSTPKIYARAYISRLRVFFRWAVKTGRVLVHPMDGMKMRPGQLRLPKDILTLAEMRSLLETPDTGETLGLRDRAILELMYSSALRRREVAELELTDVDLAARTALLREAKGRKDRVVPIGPEAARWMKRYLDDSRPLLEWDSKETAFFLTQFGRRFKGYSIHGILLGYERKMKIAKNLTPHLIRHTCATHMVQAGADLRYVQELLGHASINTTKIYTHLTISDLTEAHRKFHPRGQGQND